MPSSVIPPRPLKPDTGTLNATCTMALLPLTATKLVLAVTCAVYPRLNSTLSASIVNAVSFIACTASAFRALSMRASISFLSFLLSFLSCVPFCAMAAYAAATNIMNVIIVLMTYKFF